MNHNIDILQEDEAFMANEIIPELRQWNE